MAVQRARRNERGEQCREEQNEPEAQKRETGRKHADKGGSRHV
jgi:hypothetical protein